MSDGGGGDNKHEMPARLVIDRFEGGYAVCELDGAARPIDIKRVDIDKNAREGSVIYFDDLCGIYLCDCEATEERSLRMSNLAKKLWK